MVGIAAREQKDRGGSVPAQATVPLLFCTEVKPDCRPGRKQLRLLPYQSPHERTKRQRRTQARAESEEERERERE